MKLKNMAVCDLRSYNTLEAMQSIQSISNVAMLLVPKDMDDAVRAAYAKIKTENIAAVVEAKSDATVNIYNGYTHLSDADLPNDDAVYLVNGILWLYPLSEGKHVSVIVNGKMFNDVHNKDKVNLVTVNGIVKEVDFENTQIVPSNTVLGAEKFTDSDKQYMCDGAIFLGEVSPTACGKVIADTIFAHPSVQKGQIFLDAKEVFYTDTPENILVKSTLPQLYIGKEFLESVEGKLFVSNVSKVQIGKDVSPELLREKVLALHQIGKICTPRKDFEAVQLLAHTVAKISKKWL